MNAPFYGAAREGTRLGRPALCKSGDRNDQISRTSPVEIPARHTDAARIDVLAYSAGAQVVSPTLAELPGDPAPVVRISKRSPRRRATGG